MDLILFYFLITFYKHQVFWIKIKALTAIKFYEIIGILNKGLFLNNNPQCVVELSSFDKTVSHDSLSDLKLLFTWTFVFFP